MVENRKLFYAISLMLLTCCQMITMLPHNVANSESTLAENSNSTEYNNNNNSKTTTNELTDNGESSSYKRNTNSNSSNNTNNTNTNNNNNNKNNSDFLIIASTTAWDSKPDGYHAINTSEGVWREESQENDSTPTDNIDDLIFLDKRPINQQHHHHHHHHQHEQKEKQLQHQQYNQHHHHHHHVQHNVQENENSHYKLHHITMEGGNSNSNSDEDIDSLTDTTYSTMIVVDDELQEPASDSEHDVAIPHEIELQPDINEGIPPHNVTPLDLSDFLSLIPATKVKAIVNHYYQNDPEVQRAHAFMSSRDFLILKQHIIAIPEMSAFLHYLNNSGLDLVKFVTALTNLTAYNSGDKYDDNHTDELLTPTTILSDTSAATEISGEQVIATTTFAEINDIEFAQKQSVTVPLTISNIETQATTMTQPSATFITTTTTETTITDDINETTTTTIAAKEQLNGLHGLVDSVLDVLPQDQILATFFDKLEANEQFSKLVDNIGSPEFAKILNNMQNSIPLRNLIFTLHNNGIYVIRIVDSLKSYFFLGGF